ncbi:MAG: hypothetical protein PCFJNLEI_02436 [Verrucomicrobiae bacterium]|nr:hypothetical protein [Verrucomicrobiae bacterium]
MALFVNFVDESADGGRAAGNRALDVLANDWVVLRMRLTGREREAE